MPQTNPSFTPRDREQQNQAGRLKRDHVVETPEEARSLLEKPNGEGGKR
jgi:hypothetical protein